MLIRTLKILVPLALTICLGLMVILRQYYAFERPQSPLVELSRTIPVTVNYNKTVYVTEHDRTILYLTYQGSFACLAVIALYAVFYRSKQKEDHAA
jgi:hypothetical protein